MRQATCKSRPLAISLTLFAMTGTLWGQECGDCHEIDPDLLTGTVHEFLDCVDCHAGADLPEHPDGLEPVDCSMCHDWGEA